VDLLLNPDHVGQVDPSVRVLDGFECSILPKKWAILLQKSFKRAASWTTVKPDGYLVSGVGVAGGEEPEVKFPCFTGIA